MRQPTDIVLVSCYELGHQPFNLASPLAVLVQHGYPATAIDLAVSTLAKHETSLRHARFVGISAPMHTALRLGETAARQARALNPSAHLCFYGHYAELNAEYLLERVADSVIAGEYEPALLTLVETVLREEYSPVIPLPGVHTREQRAAPLLARIPFVQPKRDGLPPLEHYTRLRQNGHLRLAGYVEATRGCKHACRHCPITPIYNTRFFAVPQDIVLADVRAQVAQGAQHITFGDPDFLNGPGHSLRILRVMHAEFPAITFDFTAKIEHILKHAKLFPEFAALGCNFVVSAVESLSDTVLAALDKGHTRTDVEQALEIMEMAGIPLRLSLVAFTPWTALEGYLEVLNFVREHDLIDHIDPVHFSIRLLIPPGSALLAEYKDATWLGPLDRENYGYTWTHPDPRMDHLHQTVAARVALSEQQGEDHRHTFAAIEELAYAAIPAVPPTPRIVPRRRPIPAGLTESWFC